MAHDPTSEIRRLVDGFAAHRESYAHPSYKEAQLRREFIDPMWKALGWDVDNTSNYAEQYKDVIHEDAIKVSADAYTKAPDYCFRIGGVRKFFLEAKKPSVDVSNDPEPAFQLRRYAWSAKMALSVLTDFEELVVYDTRVKPDATDKASAARIMVIPFTEYVARWEELEGIFSREAVLKGSFDKYADSNKKKRGTASVDAAFLDEIEAWRDELARNIAIRNDDISQPELNFAVQVIIDRIVFLRICEDRGIEEYSTLLGTSNGVNIYLRLVELFRRADKKYNSGLFHFSHERARTAAPDSLTPNLDIDDAVLKKILRSLYYPDSPYEFSVLPADILGQVYEQFLGKVIRLTPGHQAKIEEKPEVKKAGGVFYTPTYIVDYIVKHTIGPLLDGKTPKQISGGRQGPLRILDPACGSGTFLLQAYQYLLDWYRDAYVAEGAKKKAGGRAPVLFQATGGEWRLTTSERKRILLTHIFGVDIDFQAVEVTKLSLLLKVLEGESDQTLQKTFQLFQERALPDLDQNIKRGNSLVESDFEGLGLRADGDFLQGVYPFNWRQEYPSVFAVGGFDAVIGNPPYSYRNATEDALREYYDARYESTEGNYELYKLFLEKSLDLTRAGGRVGMIVSASFLILTTFTRLRRFLLNTATVDLLAPLGPRVFSDATVDTAIVILKNAEPKKSHRVAVVAPSVPTDITKVAPQSIRQSRFTENREHVFDYRLSDESAAILDRLFDKFPPIEEGFEFGVGINTGYIKDELIATRRINSRYHPMVSGTGISRYGAVVPDGWIMYDREYVKGRGKLGRSLPAEHLLSNPKILVVRTRNLSLKRRIVATFDRSGAYNLNRLSNIVARDGYALQGLLGVLNSTLYNWIYSTRFFDYEIKPVYLRSSPMPDVSDMQLNRLVSQMLAVQARLDGARTAPETSSLERESSELDRRIDDRVYELYRVSKKERTLIEIWSADTTAS
ncbi:MAG: N-6 DNA methylase [Gemmatimonadota bacterium]|nr:N-6 DNA methylase [Gemmatimonadota bacterium]